MASGILRRWAVSVVVVAAFVGLWAPAASGASMPVLLESFPSPGAASQLEYSPQYGLLFLRNSGSAVRVVDTRTRGEVDVHLANQLFTDMDLTPDGQTLYVADWGRVSIGYGTLINPHYVHRYDLATRQWESKRSMVDTYHLEAVGPDRVVLLESDQWVDVNLERWGAGDTMTHIARASSDYYGDIEHDPVTGRIYHGNSGSSSREINVLRLNGDTFNYAGGTGVYGTAQNGGGTAVLSLDGRRFYYGALQVEALDVTNNIRTFPQPIYAATGDLAVGNSSVFDAQTGAALGNLGYSSTVFTFDPSGRELWAYANNTLYHYAVPEPAALAPLAAAGAVVAMGRRRRRRAATCP